MCWDSGVFNASRMPYSRRPPNYSVGHWKEGGKASGDIRTLNDVSGGGGKEKGEGPI